MSRPSSGERRYHHGDLRRALLEAAMGLIEENPQGDFNLRGVARAAGVSHAAPYHYFTNRNAMLRALGDEYMRMFIDEQRNALEKHDDPRERLLAMGLAYIQFADQRPRGFELIFDGALCPPDDPGPVRGPLIKENNDLLVEQVRAVQATGAWPGADAEQLATALWATVHGLAVLVAEGHVLMDEVEGAMRQLA